MTVTINNIECEGDPSQCERFYVYCDPAGESGELTGRKLDGRQFMTWADVVQHLEAVMRVPFYKIKALGE